MSESMKAEKRGHAVQVVRVLEDKTLELDEDALSSVFQQERIQLLPVAVISVAGKFRQGKSFLLGFFLRYLQAEGSSTWLDDEDAVIEGFDWKGGLDRVTTGIFIWSEPFIVETKTHGKVAVVLMDSQGTDDTSSSMAMEVPIFTLSTLLSSVLIFNVRELCRTDMENLRLFMEYGVMASKDSGSSKKPFQALQFLIRDWKHPKTYPLGKEGGAAFIENLLHKLRQGGDDLALNDAFESVQCFLLPHPGTTVDTDEFEGSVKDIEGKFMKQVHEFVELILAPGNLIPKEDFGGYTLYGAGWCALFRDYFRFFKSGKSPKPKKLFEVSRVECYEDALMQSRLYLDNETKGFHDVIVPNLEEALKLIIEFTWNIFHAVPKLGKNDKSDSKYSRLLEKIIAKKVKLLTDMNKQNIEIDELRREKERIDKEIKSEQEKRKHAENEKKAFEEKQKLDEKRRKEEEAQNRAAAARREEAAADADVGLKCVVTGTTMIGGAAIAAEAGAVGVMAVGATVAAPLVIGGTLVIYGGYRLVRWVWNK